MISVPWVGSFIVRRFQKNTDNIDLSHSSKSNFPLATGFICFLKVLIEHFFCRRVITSKIIFSHWVQTFDILKTTPKCASGNESSRISNYFSAINWLDFLCQGLNRKPTTCGHVYFKDTIISFFIGILVVQKFPKLLILTHLDTETPKTRFFRYYKLEFSTPASRSEPKKSLPLKKFGFETLLLLSLPSEFR